MLRDESFLHFCIFTMFMGARELEFVFFLLFYFYWVMLSSLSRLI